MIYLVLYDNRGQCLRVASTNDRRVAGQYINAGFVEVSKVEYDRCGELVESATLRDLPQIAQANELLGQVSTAQVQPVPNVRLAQDELDRLIKQQQATLKALTQSRVDGEIGPARWYRQMVDAINAGLIAATALGKGGLQNLNQEDTRLIQQESKTQLDYLARFRRDFDTLSPATAINRSGLYAGSATNRYWTAHTRALGLPRLPAMPGVRTSCGSNCNCNWQISKLPGLGNWDCRWRVAKSEHCEECLMRQRTFDPLEIRNGVVQPFNPNGIYV